MNQGPSDARFTDRQAQIVVLNIKILRKLESDRLILDVQEQLAERVANGFTFDPGSVAAYARDVRWYLKELTRVAADMSTDGPLLYYEEPACMIEAFRELLRDAALESKPEAADSPSLRRRIVLPPEVLGAPSRAVCAC